MALLPRFIDEFMSIFLRYHKKRIYRSSVVFLGMVSLTITSLAFGETCEGDKLVLPDAATLSSVQSSANAGDAHAQAQMGVIYLRGKGVTLDTAEGLSWLEKSAAGGSSEGQYLLAEYYSISGKTEDSLHKAVRLFKQSAENGCIPALFALGGLTKNGKGVPKNTEVGVQMISKAAESGYARAQSWFGIMLITGDGVTKDTKTGFEWVKRATSSGDSADELVLATLYLEGTGTPPNPDAARNLLESVYAKKDEQAPMAAYYLGWMYMEGKGVPIDTVKAFTWMIVAANSNVSDSVQRLKTLTEQLPKQKLIKSCNAYMDPLFETNGAKEFAHLSEGEIVAVLKTGNTLDTVYFPGRKFVGFILRQCLN